LRTSDLQALQFSWTSIGENRRLSVRPKPTSADVDNALQRILEVPSGGDSARLGDLGFDSLGRVCLIVALEERLGVSIAEERITAVTTIAQLRQLATGDAPASYAPSPKSWPYRRGVRQVGDVLRDHVIAALVRHWVTLRVEGTENLAKISSPALFIFNHSDDFDGPVIYDALPRSVRRRLCVATGADILHDHRLLAFIVRLCYGAFDFSRREPYRPSLDYVGEMLRRGWHVLFAPEGRLSTDGELLPFKPGVGYLTVTLGVEVVSLKIVGLSGTAPLHAWWPKKHSHVTVRIGEPLRFNDVSDYEAVAATLRQTIESM
jgi:long-chain acyl-CoA synthetase